MIPITKNVTVFAPDGDRLEATYPRRARGLVKKGRASFTAPDSILLNARPPGTAADAAPNLEGTMENNINNPAQAVEPTPTQAAEFKAAVGATVRVNTVAEVVTAAEVETAIGAVAAEVETAVEADTAKIEATADDIIPDAYELVNRYRGIIIEFEPRKWKTNPDVKKSSKSNRVFFTAENGELRELWQLGDWNWNWSEIITPELKLDNYTDYRVIFWLKNEANYDRNSVCRFEITFDGDYNDRSIYNLSPGFVEPLLTKDGWKLFCIPFNTGGSESCTLRFVAQHAPISVKPVSFYELSDVYPDKPLPKQDINTSADSSNSPDNAPKFDFSGIMGMETDGDAMMDRIFDFMGSPVISVDDKMKLMGMMQGILR
jgi:hypothetical protein